MIEQIDNFQNYFQSGQKAFVEQDWVQANEQFEKAYDLKQSNQILLLLVDSLYKSNQFQRAWSLIQDKEELYKISVDRANLYVDVALSNQMYLPAYEFAVSSQWVSLLSNKVQEKEIKDTSESLQTIKNRARHFFNLSDVKLEDQIKRLQIAEMLPLNYYVQGAKKLLVDPFLPMITRSTLIDRLRRLKINEEIDFLWIDKQIKKITPSKLIPLEEIYLWKKFKKFFKNNLIYDPIILLDLEKQIYLEMTISYPYFPILEVDVDAWIKVEMNNFKLLLDGEEETIQAQYHKQLLDELKNLM